MRNSQAGESGTWATLVRTYRETAKLSQQSLADHVGTDRSTVWRWENRNQKPESFTIAKRVIERLAIPLDAGLTAAGFGDDGALPDPYAYVREMGLDPNNRVVRRILNLAGVTEEFRMRALRREKQLQLRDEQARLDALEWTVEEQQKERREAS